jgi:hypothetical protein
MLRNIGQWVQVESGVGIGKDVMVHKVAAALLHHKGSGVFSGGMHPSYLDHLSPRVKPLEEVLRHHFQLGLVALIG